MISNQLTSILIKDIFRQFYKALVIYLIYITGAQFEKII